MARRNLFDKWTTDEGLTRIKGWARDGLTMIEIARNIGISKQTLYTWEKKSPDLLDALNTGRDYADRKVEESLFMSAIGYEYVEEQLSDEGVPIPVKKYAKPNTTAQIFWLKNRKPEKWRDKRDIEHEGTMNQNINMSNLTEDELRKLASMASDED
ncbi:helix-turn-helix domain-containing protein [Staphylococcus simulans]|uniref:helix-turn-helix domain-containing protein n=1 Tax=Staphylococcus simulans TaxID=1286 RepID=UPI003CF25C22